MACCLKIKLTSSFEIEWQPGCVAQNNIQPVHHFDFVVTLTRKCTCELRKSRSTFFSRSISPGDQGSQIQQDESRFLRQFIWNSAQVRFLRRCCRETGWESTSEWRQATDYCVLQIYSKSCSSAEYRIVFYWRNMESVWWISIWLLSHSPPDISF